MKVGSIESLPAGYIEVLVICILVLEAQAMGVLEPLISWYACMNPFDFPGKIEGKSSLPNLHLFFSVFFGSLGPMLAVLLPLLEGGKPASLREVISGIITASAGILFFPFFFLGIILFKSLIYVWGWIFVYRGLQNAVLLVIA